MLNGFSGSAVRIVKDSLSLSLPRSPIAQPVVRGRWNQRAIRHAKDARTRLLKLRSCTGIFSVKNATFLEGTGISPAANIIVTS